MSNKKESEERNNNDINSYKYLVGSVKEIGRIILPNAEQTREAYRALADNANMISSVASLYFPDNFSKELGVMADEMSQTLKTYLDNSAVMSQDALDSMIELISDIQKEHIQKMREIDFTSLFSSMYISVEDYSLKNLRDVVEATYKAVQEEEDSLEDDADFLSEEEVKEAIDEQINNPKGFQERIKEWSDKKIVRYYIIWKLICFLYSNFFQPYFQQNVGLPVMTWAVSNVKELPQKGAEVICQIKEGIEAVIVENTNYYYKISFTDENGIKQEGYVAKRNLRFIQQNIEDAEKNEEIEIDDINAKE